ncbi:hypothetical protein [Clostridium manihotivorum]|nr:hypothetical protein [Clostridium manihotivorum]
MERTIIKDMRLKSEKCQRRLRSDFVEELINTDSIDIPVLSNKTRRYFC